MAETNLIATSPSLKGDVSSCKTEVSIINGASRTSLWYRNDVGYATNNCTGQTDIYHSWSLTGFSMGTITIIGILIFVAFLKLIDW
jgi:hypothetical protein